MWSATIDAKDTTAKGGNARTSLGKHETRQGADDAVLTAAAKHAAATGHTIGNVASYPGATWIYCTGCVTAFHTVGR